MLVELVIACPGSHTALKPRVLGIDTGVDDVRACAFTGTLVVKIGSVALHTMRDAAKAPWSSPLLNQSRAVNLGILLNELDLFPMRFEVHSGYLIHTWLEAWSWATSSLERDPAKPRNPGIVYS